MRESVWHIIIILMISGSVFFTNLGEARLWDRDEPRNAGCAAEMMERGDWIVPTFNDELRHQKPVLLYWLIMSAYSLFGVNEFSARFWSATLALVTTLATYGIARRLTNPIIALLAAIALATSLMFDVAARAATPDSVLICCSTVAIYLYVVGTFSNSNGAGQDAFSPNFNRTEPAPNFFPSNLVAMLMYGVMGLGVLAKGPIGFVLPMAMIGMFMLVMRLPSQESDSSFDFQQRVIDWIGRVLRPFQPVHFVKTLWAMKPLLAVAMILVIAAPWYFLVADATDGEFIKRFFVGEHFGRATVALENHSGGLWYYPVAILVGFFPWSVLWGPVVVGLFHKQKMKSLDYVSVLMLCWIGVQVGVFSLAQTKLPSYVTPCYPALAILAAICLQELAMGRSKIHLGWYYAAFGGLALSGVMISAGLGFASTRFLPDQIWLAGLGVGPFMVGVSLMILLARKQTKALPNLFAFGSVVFCWLLFGFGTVSIDREQESHLVLKELGDNPATEVAAFGCLESSWVFYGGKPIQELISPGVESPQRHASLRQHFWQDKPRLTVEAFLTENPDSVFLTSTDHLEELKQRLPKEFKVVQVADYFLKNKEIYLLERSARRDKPLDPPDERVYY
ncbi:MAG: glycosyltransferase family 39 protein [Mariniblastus sp.]|nr:glycosyltransferase family 39 protein [Mariniblastus sp.]